MPPAPVGNPQATSSNLPPGFSDRHPSQTPPFLLSLHLLPVPTLSASWQTDLSEHTGQVRNETLAQVQLPVGLPGANLHVPKVTEMDGLAS